MFTFILFGQHLKKYMYVYILFFKQCICVDAFVKAVVPLVSLGSGAIQTNYTSLSFCFLEIPTNKGFYHQEMINTVIMKMVRVIVTAMVVNMVM